MSEKCRHIDGWGYYLPSHEADCTAHDCDGCQPCPETHCTARRTCTGHLDTAHPLTCPRCVGKTRGHIREIVRLSGLVLDEAIETGVDSEAANLAGPAADPEASMWRRLASVDKLADLEPDDDRHPLTVLGTWDMMLREDYDQPTGLRCTITRSADYLDGQLQRLAQDEAQDFPLFASEIRACLSHLEDVLAEGQRRETGAPCPACAPAPSLVKHYAHWCDREDCTREHDATGAKDAWRCPACRAEWSEADYRLWVAEDYLTNADELTAADIAMVYEIPASTVRRWASSVRGEEPRLSAVGRDDSGRKLYRVEDVLEIRDKESAKSA